MAEEIETSKIEMPPFLKLPLVLLKTEENENLGTKAEFMIVEVRINPYHITSYYPRSYGKGEDEKGCTSVNINGGIYWIDMQCDEFDKLIEKTSREINIKSPK
ncbi:MAG: hypothetical protein V4538_15135 [Bacteroidota bacterium]